MYSIIRPPFFPHYFVPKVGRGLILEYAVSLDYMPPQPFLLHTVQVQLDTTKGHVYIRADVLHANYYVSESSLHKLSPIH